MDQKIASPVNASIKITALSSVLQFDFFRCRLSGIIAYRAPYHFPINPLALVY